MSCTLATSPRGIAALCTVMTPSRRVHDVLLVTLSAMSGLRPGRTAIHSITASRTYEEPRDAQPHLLGKPDMPP
jgi:hypothetical protein